MFGRKKNASSSASSIASKEPIFHAGINNLGNTCYLGSTLQALAASTELRAALSVYPGAERALNEAARRGSISLQDIQRHTVAAKQDDKEKEASTYEETAAAPSLVAAESETGEPSSIADEKAASGESALETPTVETSPSLHLLHENPYPEELPMSVHLADSDTCCNSR